MDNSQPVVCSCHYGVALHNESIRSFLDLAQSELQFAKGQKSNVHIFMGRKGKRVGRLTVENVNHIFAEGVEGFTISERSARTPLLRDYEKIIFCQRGFLMAAVCGEDQTTVQKIQRLTVEGALLLNSSYAFMTTVPYGFLPPLWCGGIISGFAQKTLPPEEVESIGQWMNYGILEREYETGRLRGVYELNILNEAQVRRKIQGMPLLEWIKHHQHGTCLKLSNHLYRWDIERDAGRALEATLRSSGVIA